LKPWPLSVPIAHISMCDQEEPLCVGGASCSDGPFISLGWEFGKRIDWKLREMGSSLSPSEPGKRYLRTSPYIVVFSTAPSAWVRLSPALHTRPMELVTGWSWPLPFIHAWVGQEVKEGRSSQSNQVVFAMPKRKYFWGRMSPLLGYLPFLLFLAWPSLRTDLFFNAASGFLIQAMHPAPLLGLKRLWTI